LETVPYGNLGFIEKQIWIWIQALGKLFNISNPQFLHLWSRNGDASSLAVRIQWDISGRVLSTVFGSS
jgi:hypothetical protein